MSDQMDKRVIRTRKRLHNALLKLMKTKNIREITVKELVEEAGINRSTFYLHYNSVPEILESLQQFYLDKVLEISKKDYVPDPENHEDTDAFSFVVDLLMLSFDHLDLCYAIFGPHGDPVFQQKITKIIEDMIMNRIYQILGHKYRVSHFLSTFYIQGCIMMLIEWTFQPSIRPNPEKMAILSYRLVMAFVHFIEDHPEIDQWLMDDSISSIS